MTPEDLGYTPTPPPSAAAPPPASPKHMDTLPMTSSLDALGKQGADTFEHADNTCKAKKIDAYLKNLPSIPKYWRDSSVDDAMTSMHQLLQCAANWHSNVSVLSAPIHRPSLDRFASVTGERLSSTLYKVLAAGGNVDLLIWAETDSGVPLIDPELYQHLYWRTGGENAEPWANFRLKVTGLPIEDNIHFFTVIHDATHCVLRIVERAASDLQDDSAANGLWAPGIVIADHAVARTTTSSLLNSYYMSFDGIQTMATQHDTASS